MPLAARILLILSLALTPVAGILSLEVTVDGAATAIEFGVDESHEGLSAVARRFAAEHEVDLDDMAAQLVSAMQERQAAAREESRVYAQQSQDVYDHLATEHRMDANGLVTADAIVGLGTFHEHNEWADMAYLFEGYDDHATRAMVALDFGTGPGRNIVKFRDRFARIDGVDIARTNLVNADASLSGAGDAFLRHETPTGTPWGAQVPPSVGRAEPERPTRPRQYSRFRESLAGETRNTRDGRSW